MSKNLSALLKKREKLEAEILAAEAAAKRKTEVADWAEFAGILSLPESVLRAGFARIATENITQN